MLFVGPNRRRTNENDFIVSWEKIQTVAKPSRPISDEMISRDSIDPQGRLLWAHELHKELSKLEWSKLMRYVNSITLSTKLRYFQYRLLNRKIMTNYKRNK